MKYLYLLKVAFVMCFCLMGAGCQSGAKLIKIHNIIIGIDDYDSYDITIYNVDVSCNKDKEVDNENVSDDVSDTPKDDVEKEG
jgi:hypothetical protein